MYQLLVRRIFTLALRVIIRRATSYQQNGVRDEGDWTRQPQQSVWLTRPWTDAPSVKIFSAS